MDWASSAESEIEEAFDEGGFVGSSIDELECRSTFCRIAARHETLDSRNEFEELTAMVKMGAVGIPIESDGELKTVLYFIRKRDDRPEHPARRIVFR